MHFLLCLFHGFYHDQLSLNNCVPQFSLFSYCRNLQNAELQLGELSAGLMDVDTKVASLKGQLSTYTKEAAEVEIQLNKAQGTLAAAEGLVGKLNEEYERWQQQVNSTDLISTKTTLQKHVPSF